MLSTTPPGIHPAPPPHTTTEVVQPVPPPLLVEEEPPPRSTTTTRRTTTGSRREGAEAGNLMEEEVVVEGEYRALLPRAVTEEAAVDGEMTTLTPLGPRRRGAIKATEAADAPPRRSTRRPTSASTAGLRGLVDRPPTRGAAGDEGEGTRIATGEGVTTVRGTGGETATLRIVGVVGGRRVMWAGAMTREGATTPREGVRLSPPRRCRRGWGPLPAVLLTREATFRELIFAGNHILLYLQWQVRREFHQRFKSLRRCLEVDATFPRRAFGSFQGVQCSYL